jgi:hypothetical protein
VALERPRRLGHQRHALGPPALGEVRGQVHAGVGVGDVEPHVLPAETRGLGAAEPGVEQHQVHQPPIGRRDPEQAAALEDRERPARAFV